MTNTKRPCADCTNVEPCDMLERCIKHDPVPKVHDEYTQLTIPDTEAIMPCPVCSADAELWQYIAKPGDPAQKVVCCSHSESIGPHEALAGGGCPLYLPPLSFYRPTIREAVKHWHEYAKALRALRRSNERMRSSAETLAEVDKAREAGRIQGFEAVTHGLHTLSRLSEEMGEDK